MRDDVAPIKHYLDILDRYPVTVKRLTPVKMTTPVCKLSVRFVSRN